VDRTFRTERTERDGKIVRNNTWGRKRRTGACFLSPPPDPQCLHH
jgi:hypothetical protein